MLSLTQLPEYNNIMIFQGDRHLLLARRRCQPPKTKSRAAGICGGTITMSIALKNHVITLITTYPSNLENIFIICVQLQHMPTCLRRNHLAKYHRSPPQESTRIKPLWTCDHLQRPPPLPRKVYCYQHIEQSYVTCTSPADTRGGINVG